MHVAQVGGAPRAASRRPWPVSGVLSALLLEFALSISPVPAVDDVERDNFLSKVSPSTNVLGFDESFYGYSGQVSIRLPGPTLKGKGGLDLVVRPYYNSEIWNRTDGAEQDHVASIDTADHLGGNGWQLHFGKVINPDGTGSNYQLNDNPTVILPDGSTKLLWASTAAGELISEDRWNYAKVDLSTYELTATNGTVYTFSTLASGAGALSMRGTAIAQCTRVEDVHGNAITIDYSNGLPTVATDTWGREVTFDYYSGSDRIQFMRVKNSGAELQKWEFVYSSSYWEESHPQGLRRAFNLLTVKPPEGSSWTFSYYPSFNSIANGRLMLDTMTLPTGGTVKYSYEQKLFDVGCQGSLVGRAVLKSRVTAGRDVSSGTWNYTYTNPGKSGMIVGVAGPSGSGYSESHVFEGFIAYSGTDQTVWKVGRPRSRTVTDLEQSVVETFEWQEDELLSNDTRLTSNWNGCGSARLDADIHFVKPLEIERTTTRDSHTWTTTQSAFNDYGNPETVTESGDLNRTTALQYFYNPALNIVDGRLSRSTAVPGEVQAWSYNSLGLKTRDELNPGAAQDDVNDVETIYDYHANGDLWKIITNTGAYGPDQLREFPLANYSFGLPEKELVYKDSGYITINRDATALGLAAWEEDGRGTTTQTDYTYDKLGRVKTIAPPVGCSTSFVYASDNSTVTVTRNACGSVSTDYVTEYDFDGFGRLTEWRDLETTNRREVDYDNMGRRTEERLYLGGNAADVRTFDDLGRLSEVAHPDSTSISYLFDGVDVTITDEEGDTTFLNYSAFGSPEGARLESVTDGRAKTWDYQYDGTTAKLEKILPPAGSAFDREFKFTTKGLPDYEDHPENGKIELTYSPARDLVFRSFGGLSATNTTFEYNRQGLLKKIDVAATADDVTITYNDAGLRELVANSYAVIDPAWDSAGRLDSYKVTLNGALRTTDYTFDEHDRLEAITYPSGRQIHYSRDAAGRIERVWQAGQTDFVSSITYHPSGMTDRVTYGNGAYTDFSYDSRFRPTLLDTQAQDLNLDYDYASRIKDWDSGLARTFGYDDLGRLTSAIGPGGEALSYTYDDVGNRLTRVGDGVTETYDYVGDEISSTKDQKLNDVTGGYDMEYIWDAAGRLTHRSPNAPGGETIDFTYTPLGQLATATVVAEGSATASYYYDGDGRRVQTIRGSDHVHYLRDADGNIIAEYDSAGSLLLEHIYLDGRRIATVLPTGHRFYIQQDVLGSNWQVTTSAFSLTSLFESYEPFGWVMPDIDTESAPIPLSGDVLCTGANPIFCDDFETGDTTLWTCTDPGTCASDPTAPRYTGKDLDQLTGLYDFDARYYDGRIGRFISPDPGPWHLENPQSINRYAYALNSPYKYVDPDGESPVVLGALIGGGVGAVGYLTANLIANDFSISASVDAISGRDLLASTVGGATSGALAVATFGFSLVGEGVIGATAAGALGNVVGGYVTRSLDTDSSTNPADLRSAGQDLAFGALGGSFGYGAGQLARSPLPGVRAQIEASRPGARAGNWGSAQSVRGHTAKVARIENLATAVDASIGETSTSVAQPVIEAIREKEN